MTSDQIEQVARILAPTIRETVRGVMQEELEKLREEVAVLRTQVDELKAVKGKVLGIWTLIIFIVSLIAKAAWDVLQKKFGV